MDAVLGIRFGSCERLLARGGASLEPLQEALRRADAALVESMRSAVDALRGTAPPPTSGLSAALGVAVDRSRDLREEPTSALPELNDEERRSLLAEIDARRRLFLRQGAIERWIAGGQEWESTP